MTVPATKTFASSVLLWFRPDLTREAARDHWRGPHAQLVARTPGFKEYRQHHFVAATKGLWPSIPGVETVIPDSRRIDGMPEVILDGIFASLKGREQQKLVFADEPNVFARTILYVCPPGSGRRYSIANAGRVKSRAVVLLRKNATAEPKAFKNFVNGLLGPTLAQHPLVRELHTQVFMPWQLSHWDTPGVAHDNPPEAQFHSSVVIGFDDQDARQSFFDSLAHETLQEGLAGYCTAIHAYPVEDTYIYVKDGRVTLPQPHQHKLQQPVPKPPLAPAKRILPPIPPRSLRPSSEKPFPSARLIKLTGRGAEDVVVDANGLLLCGLADGRIVRVNPADGHEETVGNTGGRPLGMEVLADGRVLVCDCHRGLLRLDPSSGAIETLVREIDGIPLRFCSNVTAASDGTYWFTESTNRFDFEHFVGAMLEHRPSGRLFRRDPDGNVEVVLDNLHFANGVTLTENEDALIFAETDGYRLTRLSLTGATAGQRTVIADNLPGFPDNLSKVRDGQFWVALVNPRSPQLDGLGKVPGWIRNRIWRSGAAGAKESGTVWTMAFDANGTVKEDFQTTRSDFSGATGVTRVGDKLYLVGVDYEAILEIDLGSTS